MTDKNKDKALRILPGELQKPDEEGHRLAKEAMEPFLKPLQAAANEEFAKQFGGIDYCTCKEPQPQKNTAPHAMVLCLTCKKAIKETVERNDDAVTDR